MAVAVLTLALGVGANASIFSVVNAVLLEPLPYNDPDGLLMIRRLEQAAPGERRSMSQPDLEDLRGSESLAGITGFQRTSLTLTGQGEPEVVSAAAVIDGLMRVFGVAPLLGRDLSADDNVPNGPRVVVISHSFWQTRLAASEEVIGSLLELEGEDHEIVGVAPKGFEFPLTARLWVPLYNDVEGCGRDCHFLTGIARLAVTLSAVGLYGVVSYLVARRTHELAIRLAIGATAGSVVRLVLRQGLKPVLGGVAIGLVAALVGARLLGSLLYEVEPDDPKTYLGVTLLLALVSMLALIAPAGRAARLAPARALKED